MAWSEDVANDVDSEMICGATRKEAELNVAQLRGIALETVKFLVKVDEATKKAERNRTRGAARRERIG